MRYRWAGPYKTRQRAEDSLEDSFATGEVSQGEAPRIEVRKDHRGRVIGYVVTLEDWA